MLDKELRQGSERGISAPQFLPIDLSVALTDKEYSIAGNFFYIYSAPDQTSYITVKTNPSDIASPEFVFQTGFKGPFTKLYITTPAGQTGTMKIMIAAQDPQTFEVIDNRSGISASMINILTELQTGAIAVATANTLAELQGITAAGAYDTEDTVGMAAAVEILAPNAARKGCIIQSKEVNGGHIYLGFDNAVTSSKWVVELQAGMAFSVDDYRGPIFAISDVAGQLVGFGEW